jgi:hypothetical protein
MLDLADGNRPCQAGRVWQVEPSRSIFTSWKRVLSNEWVPGSHVITVFENHMLSFDMSVKLLYSMAVLVAGGNINLKMPVLRDMKKLRGSS